MTELTREQWLEERKNHLGATDCVRILTGRGLEVYASKTVGDVTRDERWLRYGRAMEAPVAEMYADESGREVVDLGATTFQRHPEIPWLAATLDRQTFDTELDGPGACEIKNTDVPGLRPENWSERNPELLNFIIQNQMQMACTQWDWGTVVGKFPYYSVAWFDLKRDERFFDAALPVLEDFWTRVQNREPPPPAAGRDLEVVKRLYPRTSDIHTMVLKPEHMEVALQWDEAKKACKEWGERKKKCEAQLRAVIRDAEYGALPDGTFLSLKTTAKKGGTRVVESGEYRVLRRCKTQR